MAQLIFENPFKPGAGHRPPYLAGRTEEKQDFIKLLTQTTILENVILTGLRGVGKTVLLEEFKVLAIKDGWMWVGNDFSEVISISDENLAIRILTDLSLVTSLITIDEDVTQRPGFGETQVKIPVKLDYTQLVRIYQNTPGLIIDKLKHILELSWFYLSKYGKKGMVFAYDEAQNLSDHESKTEFPLSLILDLFQSIQRKGIPYMLVLTGLPTLFPKLVDARTYSERMFKVLFLKRLLENESKEAILKPIGDTNCPVSFSAESVSLIIQHSGGYPYFIQFICREVFDIFIQKIGSDQPASVPVNEIIRKLDKDFFSARWSRASDRQKEIMIIISRLENCDKEFTVQEVVEESKKAGTPIGNSNANQMLSGLIEKGLLYKNRHGRYMFAVPLLGNFIRRQESESDLTLQ